MNREEFDEELKHFLGCINYKESAFDARAITFLNLIGNHLNDLEGKPKT